MIAALYVDPRGCYAGLPDVDLWDEDRDARRYPGPHPVVAHPPCTRWCRLAGLVEARWGHRKGDDGGCFAAALAAVRRWGGVLEHPAWSDAWPAYDLPAPPTGGGWQGDLWGGWSCHVEQGRYGHPAKKATWLYAVRTDLPELRWGRTPDGDGWPVQWRDGIGRRSSRAMVSWCGNHTPPRVSRRPMVGRTHREVPRAGYDERPRLSSRQASSTPPEFMDLLLGLARSVS